MNNEYDLIRTRTAGTMGLSSRLPAIQGSCPCQDGRRGTEGTQLQLQLQLHDGAFLAVGAAAAADTLLVPVPVPVPLPMVVVVVTVVGGHGPAARQGRSC